MFRFLLVITFLFNFSYSNSQSILANTKHELEAGTFFSTANTTPFWLRSNQYGIVPLRNPFFTIRASAYKNYDSTIYVNKKLKKFDYGYGLGGVINAGNQSSILLPEAYLKVRYGAFEFYGGRRKEMFGLVDTILTSGSYIWSGNALPIPKIQISIPNFIPIIGQGLVSIKGGIAHGWFDNGLIKHFFLHQKWLYGRIGKPNWRIKLYAGLNHQVQWGGYPLKPYVEPQTGKLISNFGNDFTTFLNVVTGVSLNKKGGTLLNGVPINDAWNRSGNHLGTLDIAAEITLRNFDIFTYRQSIYEDGSLFYLNNITDGLYGISVKIKGKENGISQFGFEYINTTSQGGNTGGDNAIPQLRGRDNYFNNSIYLDGWTYKGNIIGTPLFTKLDQLNPKLLNGYDLTIIPNSFIFNNRIVAYNLSLLGKINNFKIASKISWSLNKGLYELDIHAKQLSFLQHISYSLGKYEINLNFSFDKGFLYYNNLGGYLGIRRVFP